MLETMDGKARVTAGKPLSLLLVLSAVAMLTLGAMAQNARRGGRCGLNLPWDRITSEAWLQTLFRSAWSEVQTLRRISSDCTAQLHTDFAVSGLIVLAISVVISVIICLLCGVLVGRLHIGSMKSIRSKIKIILGVPFLYIIVLFLLNSSTIIDFTGKRLRSMVPYDGVYINTFSYAMVTTAILGALVFAVAGTGALVGTAWRGSRTQRQAKDGVKVR
jgi:hypothetical protein